MPLVVEQLAELTADRDRDVADTTLAATLRDLLQAREVAIHRCVGEDSDLRWLTRARLGLDDVVAKADPLYSYLNDLPALDAFPARLQALQRQAPVALAPAAPDGPQLTVFPLTTDRQVVGVLELLTSAPLDTAAHRLVGSILRLYRNFQALLDHSERDTLTGLLNRKTFDEAFYKLSPLLGGIAFERADRAVYWAKTPGRNQVFSHAALVASGELADDSKVGDVALC